MTGRPAWRVEWFDKRGARQTTLVLQRWFPDRAAAAKHVAEAFSDRLGYIDNTAGAMA